MLIIMVLVVFLIFILGFLLDISLNLRRLNGNIKKLVK
jgi:hypothetical protein